MRFDEYNLIADEIMDMDTMPGFWRLSFQEATGGYICEDVSSEDNHDTAPLNFYYKIRELFSRDRMAYYRTFEEARDAMLDIAHSRNDIRMFTIEKHPFNGEPDFDDWTRQYIFDHEGKLLDRSVCSSYHWDKPGLEGQYLGRSPTMPRYKPGDIVEITTIDTKNKGIFARLAIVIWEGPSRKSFHKTYLRSLSRKDFTDIPMRCIDDDEYFVQFGPFGKYMNNFSFESALDMLPPRFPVPDIAREKLAEWYKTYLEAPDDEKI